ncbi:MAG: glycosyltransferase [Actinobacteria bacterium]|uniref:Unannotated protein n=1 Tax=freshwater metagenome TaxID=449393 RepID=A0A6J6TS10_9ZZZZ|nr:glycosyltransferase [Actinomycetota bacterium]
MGQGVHDRRFIACAQGNGWEVLALRCDGQDNDVLSRARSTRWVGNRESISGVNQKSFRSEFREVVDRFKPDLIQVGPLTNVAAVLDENLGVPVLAVSWARDLLHDVNESEWCKEVAISAIKLSDHMLVDCKTVCEAALRLGAFREDISIVPWGVDLHIFDFYHKKSISAVPKIVSIRSLEKIYSVSSLIEAARELTSLNANQKFEIVIAGDGSLKTSLESLAGDYGLSHSTKFVGTIPESDLPQELLKCDIYVSTSPTDGSSISMLQAMALGLPCIVTDIPSNREWIEHGINGLLYEPHNSRALAEILSEAIANSELLSSFAEKARKTVVERADWKKGRKLIAEIYEHVAFT